MKRSIIKIAALVLALLMAGCAQPAAQQPIDVTAPSETPSAQQQEAQPQAVQTGDGYAILSEELLLPQDVPEEEAVYRLSYQVPQFESEASNAAVSVYLDELYTRVTAERMPYADPVDSLPYTSVTFDVQKAELPAGIYTNFIFIEEHSFAGESEAQFDRHVIVMGPDGSECSLAAVSGAYFPEDMAVQQVVNVIAYEPDSYYGDLTADTILSALDLYNGFAVSDEAYTLFIPAGAIAPEEKGMVEISFPHRALYPGFVGDVMDEEDYSALLPMLSAAAAACGPDFTGFAGAPEGELAAAIIGEYFDAQGLSFADAAAYAAAYADAYKAMFGIEARPAGEVIAYESDLPFYGVQWEDAHADGETLILSGQLMSGAPGSSSAAPAATVSAQVKETGDGWIIQEFEIM
ncbi:MAG: hypothetical protein IKU32_06055 [Clostridia bacterium]|nr:hypothetical protein [Clostridia bacterium]